MLPPLYDKDAALASLLAISDARSDTASDWNGIYGQLGCVDLSLTSVVKYEEPLSWRLSKFNEETQKMEPVLLRIQGVLTETMLPPIRKPVNQAASDKMRPHIRQAVSLTGLGCESFIKAVAQIEEIHILLSNEQPIDSMQQWAPSFLGDHPVLSAHNRYFTRTVAGRNQDRIGFGPNIDPDGYLASMEDGRFFHGYDNSVEYYMQISSGPSGNKKIIVASPGAFRPGDIVEILTELCVFPTGTKSIFVIQLKAIRMLSTDHRTKASILEMRSRYKPEILINRVPKRKGLYDDEEIQETGDTFKRMTVSDPRVDP